MWAVLFGFADFWRHVEGRTDIGGGKVVRLQHLGEAEVAELDRVVLVKEDLSVLVWRACAVRITRVPTIVRLQVAMQDDLFVVAVSHGLRVCAQAHDVLRRGRWVLCVMATVECAQDLAEDGPDEFLVGKLVFFLELPDDATKIAVAAVLHI